MGYSSYSVESRASYANSVKSLSENQIFTQNVKKEIKSDMSPVDLGVREARDSDVHPNTMPVIIALDVTGSMGRIPVNIIKDDLTHLMESLIHKCNLPDVTVMFLGIGDQGWDSAPLQVGQFESGDQDLAKWLSSTWIEHGGGGDRQESYNLAWVVAAKHTVTDAWEKRKQKGFLFTVGDEGFHDQCNINKVFGSGQSADSIQYLKDAQERYHVYHIHANHGSYPNNQVILNQWREAIGQNLLIANTDKEIIQKIIDTINATLSGSQPIKTENTEEGPITNKSDEQEIL